MKLPFRNYFRRSDYKRALTSMVLVTLQRVQRAQQIIEDQGGQEFTLVKNTMSQFGFVLLHVSFIDGSLSGLMLKLGQFHRQLYGLFRGFRKSSNGINF